MRVDREESRRKGTYDLEALEEIIATLVEASGSGAVVIVEGLRDEKALRTLGVSGPVVRASRRPALDLAEETARGYSDIIILTDWDEKGDEMAGTLNKHLRASGIKPDLDIRGRLKTLVRKEIKDVESLGGYVERMREAHGK